MRVLICRLFHETNTFAEGMTHVAGFRCLFGVEMLAGAAPGSMVDRIAKAGSEFGCECIPGFDIGASPGPLVSDDVVFLAMTFLDRIFYQTGPRNFDGIFLVLHGAMVAESYPDVEGVLLRRIRKHVSADVPVAVILDLHANVSCEMAKVADILSAYRCNPHTDSVESGLRTFRLLASGISSGQSYRTLLVQVPWLLPPDQTATDQPPMRELVDFVRGLETPDLPDISVCAGFAHADIKDAGLSFQIVHRTGALEKARQAGELMRELACSLMTRPLPEGEDLEIAVRTAWTRREFPALIVEPADNIGGGARGDSTWVLEVLLRLDARGSGVILTAPEVVQLLAGTPEGQSCEIRLGGELTSLKGPPLELLAEVRKHCDGHFTVEDPQSHFVASRGERISMGPSCLVEAGGILILLTTLPTPPMDLGQWRCVGVDPAGLTLIGIKAAIGHRKAYDPIAKSSWTVATPGVCTSDLRLLPYRKIRRPIFPLDP